MFAIVQNGIVTQLIPDGTQFTVNGVNYPANWCNLSTPEEKAAIGMVDVVYGPQPNQTYYWVSENAPVYNPSTNQVDINFTATAKDLATCQSNQVTAINTSAYSLLQPSDWLVVRSVESGGTFPVPVAWNQWRQTIRNEASAAVTAINACTTVDELAALPAVAWTPDPDHANPVNAGEAA